MSVCFFWQPATYGTFLITIVFNVFVADKVLSLSLTILPAAKFDADLYRVTVIIIVSVLSLHHLEYVAPFIASRLQSC